MPEPITLPPKARQHLAQLFAASQQAKTVYEAALTAALLSLGCCVTRSRQCVADDHLPSGEFIQFDDVDCAAAITIVPPTKPAELLWVAGSFAACVAAGWLCHVWFEKPLLNWAKKDRPAATKLPSY